jgi:KUP system potassium uptake protein
MTTAGNSSQNGQGASAEPHAGSFWSLTLGSVGVVYGDIGTSPLYAMREALRAASGDGATREEVIGVVSLLLWALILIVTLKYVLFLLRADNKGEGGILSLLALAQSALGRRTSLIFVLGIAGASLFYGDAVITPAISVLSAVEGLELVTPAVNPYVMAIALAILISLFAVQNRGTQVMARWFGPIMAVWFVVMGVLGIVHISDDPEILAAFNPAHAISFLGGHGFVAFVVLGAVFLAVTGAEALYADLGHFGRRPIQTAWLGLVLPALALNYLGQGALVLSDPTMLRNPFFLMAPEWGLLPLVVLAALATVIASQATVTGAFSLTRQAIQLGLLPRLDIRHTSAEFKGQIYLPLVNGFILTGVIMLVLIFETSSALAGAYGIAVSGTMLVTSTLALIYFRVGGRWPLALVLAVIGPIMIVEVAFVAANMMKLAEGGYVPLLLAGVLMVMMWTWTRGTAILVAKARRMMVPLADFVTGISRRPPARVPGTAIFLTSDPVSTPGAMLHNLKHNQVLHEKNVILTVRTTDEPRVADADRVSIGEPEHGFRQVEVRFGYMETPNLTYALALCRKQGLQFDIMATSFFLGRRKLKADARSGMPLWQDRLFIAMASVAADPTDFYHLPPDRVVELGAQVKV